MIFNLRLLVWQSEPMERRGRLAGGLDPNTGVSYVGYRELAPPSALASRVAILGLDMLRSSDGRAAEFVSRFVHDRRSPRKFRALAGSHSLAGSCAALGRMLEGGAVLDTISAVPTQGQAGLEDVPVTEIVVKSVSRMP